MSQSLFYSLATIGSLIVAFGPVAPSGVRWVAEHSVTSSVFYVVATVRVAFGTALKGESHPSPLARRHARISTGD